MNWNIVISMSLLWLVSQTHCYPFQEEVQQLISGNFINFNDRPQAKVGRPKRREVPQRENTNRTILPPVRINNVLDITEVCKEERYSHLRICKPDYKPPAKCSPNFAEITTEMLDEQKETNKLQSQQEETAASSAVQSSLSGTNPCGGGLYFSAVYEAVGYYDGVIYEVVLLGEYNQYQSFILQDCAASGSPVTNFKCEIQTTVYRTLVYVSPISDDTVVKFVIIPGTCHLVYN